MLYYEMLVKDTKERWNTCKRDLGKLTVKEWWGEHNYDVSQFVCLGLIGLIIVSKIAYELLG